jgi:archaellum component FlaD/FlaE
MYQRLTTMFGRNNDTDEPASPDDDTEAEPAATEPTELETAASEPDGPDPAELDVRINELEDDIDSTESAVRAVQSSQEEMAQSVEEMNERVRQLTGVYDRLMAEENPFIDDTRSGAAPDGNGGTGNDHGIEPAEADESVVGFDDLDAGGDEVSTGTSDHAADETPDAESLEEVLDAVAPSAGPSADDAAVAQADPSESAPDTSTATMADGEREPLLDGLPDGYAGDALVMEWLGALMERSGPAGALRAVEHYEEIGWISPDVKRRLIDIIGGPSLDVFVDPMQPREPTGAEHQASHGYLTVLAELDDI